MTVLKGEVTIEVLTDATGNIRSGTVFHGTVQLGTFVANEDNLRVVPYGKTPVAEGCLLVDSIREALYQHS